MSDPNELNDLILLLDDEEEFEIDMDDSQPLDLEMHEPFWVIDRNYNKLRNKPMINGIVVEGIKSQFDYKIRSYTPMSNETVERIIQLVYAPTIEGE